MTAGCQAGQALLGLSPNIRIINLAHRIDRRREVEQELAALGLAIGDDIRFEVAARPDDAGDFPTIGARGCFLSHLGVLEAAVADELASVTILEDDLSFSAEEIGRISSAVAAANTQPWSIFYGGVLKYGDGLEQVRPEPVFDADPNAGMMGSHFIVVRGDAIAMLAKYFTAMLGRPAGSPEGGPMHVDGAYSWFRANHPQMLTIVANPELGHQRASRTDVHDLRWHDRVPVVRDVVAFLRRFR